MVLLAHIRKLSNRLWIVNENSIEHSAAHHKKQMNASCYLVALLFKGPQKSGGPSKTARPLDNEAPVH